VTTAATADCDTSLHCPQIRVRRFPVGESNQLVREEEGAGHALKKIL
jgi:hypothetical protein